MKKTFLLIITIFTITNLFSQEQTWWQNRKDKVVNPIYVDVDLGVNVNIGVINPNLYVSAGLALTEYAAVGLDYTYAAFGHTHRSSNFKGTGVQFRYARFRLVGKFTAGLAYDYHIKDIDLSFDMLSNSGFYYKTSLAYRFGHVCSVGLAYTRTSAVRYRLIDFDNTDLGVRSSQLNHFALTIGVHIFPPHIPSY
ncbi:MAG: hypothetical protein AB8G11_24510 [Saprospiraceae bacterium]